jgi:hypothetical protein
MTRLLLGQKLEPGKESLGEGRRPLIFHHLLDEKRKTGSIAAHPRGEVEIQDQEIDGLESVRNNGSDISQSRVEGSRIDFRVAQIAGEDHSQGFQDQGGRSRANFRDADQISIGFDVLQQHFRGRKGGGRPSPQQVLQHQLADGDMDSDEHFVDSGEPHGDLGVAQRIDGLQRGERRQADSYVDETPEIETRERVRINLFPILLVNQGESAEDVRPVRDGLPEGGDVHGLVVMVAAAPVWTARELGHHGVELDGGPLLPQGAAFRVPQGIDLRVRDLAKKPACPRSL